MSGKLSESVAKILARQGSLSGQRGGSAAGTSSRKLNKQGHYLFEVQASGFIRVHKLASKVVVVRDRATPRRRATDEAALLAEAQRLTPSREKLREIRANLPKLTFNYDGEPG